MQQVHITRNRFVWSKYVVLKCWNHEWWSSLYRQYFCDNNRCVSCHCVWFLWLANWKLCLRTRSVRHCNKNLNPTATTDQTLYLKPLIQSRFNVGISVSSVVYSRCVAHFYNVAATLSNPLRQAGSLAIQLIAISCIYRRKLLRSWDQISVLKI